MMPDSHAPIAEKFGLATSQNASVAINLVRRIISEQWPKHWLAYLRVCAQMAVVSGSTAVSAYIVGHVVNSVYVYADLRATIGTSLAIAALFIVRGLATYGQILTLASVNSAIAAEYQVRIFDKTLQENLTFFSDRHSSELNAAINFAGGSVGATLSTLIVAGGRDALTLIGLAGVMVFQDPLLSLVSLLVLPATALTVRKLRVHVRRLVETQYARVAAMYETGQEALQGLRIIKAFGLELQQRQKFRKAAINSQQAIIDTARATGRSGPLLEALGGVAVGLLFMYGGYRVLATGATPGSFFSFLVAFLLAYEPIKRLARVHIDLEASLVGVRMLFETLDRPASEPDDSHLPDLYVTKGQIDLEDIDFAYRHSEPVLRKLSLNAQANRLTALVGVSGGGKSTIFNLILRFYEPSAGRILIDGQDISKVTRASVRRQIAYVGQDIFLFRGSIRDNIAVGKPNATNDEIGVAAHAAFAHDFISKLPGGYDTQVGEYGLQLSAGQRQRIAVARALIRNAPIILLDEPTASLDNESERQVRDAIARLCKDRTTLIIAHRLHTIMDADCICVVENGTIMESGAYPELLAAQGRFAAFCRLQFKDEAA